jgi:hypothetical protein
MTDVVVKPFSATLTRDTETFGTMDPYVKVKLGGNFQRGPTHENGGKNPSWQCSMKFQRTNETCFVFEIWNSNSSKDDMIAQGSVDWDSAFANGRTKFNDWVALTYKGKPSGKLLVDLELQGVQQNQQQNLQQQQQFQQPSMFQQQQFIQPQQQMFVQQQPLLVQQQPQFIQQPIIQQQPMFIQQQPIIQQQPMFIPQQQVVFQQQQPQVIIQQQPTFFPQQKFF